MYKHEGVILNVNRNIRKVKKIAIVTRKIYNNCNSLVCIYCNYCVLS